MAKLLEGTLDITQTGEVCGTPDYMSPEQCLGMPLDERSDIYSMGCLMYESLTGTRKASADAPLLTLYRQIHEQPVPPTVCRPALASVPSIDKIVLKALSKDPGSRYSSFAELRSALLLGASQTS